ncbi:hypothetical protein HN51_035768 [Arachis hypogaea]
MRMNEWHVERRSSFETEYPLARESSNVSETGSLSIVVLGAFGDLAKKKMFPALFHLYQQDLFLMLGEFIFRDSYNQKKFIFFGYAGTKISDDELRGRLRG